MTPTRENLLAQLETTAARLLELYRHMPDSNTMIYEAWSAKDVLAHLTFWHESFARNVSDLAQGKKPAPLKGRLADLNQAGVDEMRPYPLDAVLERFEAAQELIGHHILHPSLGLIPYRRGSRPYSPEEHLKVVNDHLEFHLKDTLRALHREKLHSNKEILCPAPSTKPNYSNKPNKNTRP